MKSEKKHPQTVLTAELTAQIERLRPRYPSARAMILPALHLIHERLRCVAPDAVVELAKLLGLHPAEVQDTLSFYGFFKQDAPVGQTRVWVCRSISCAACGGEELLEHLKRRLGIAPGETTADGQVTLEFAECLGACDGAPAVLAGETLHTNVTIEKLDALIDGWLAAPAGRV